MGKNNSIKEIKLCDCGCGNPAPIAKYTRTKMGWKKGEPKRFIKGHAINIKRPPPLFGKDNPKWNGGNTKCCCAQCGKEFERKPSQAKRAKNNFCSTKCSGLWKSANLSCENSHLWNGGAVKVVCCQCGKEFEKTHASIRQSKKHFCSYNCKYIWQSINQCGENNPMWNGGVSLGVYCPIWTSREFKEYIFERDGHRCQNPDCLGTGTFLVRHHINYEKKDCNPSNIITVCNSCNARANVDRDWHTAYYQALMDKRFNKGEQTMNINPITS